MEKRLEEEVQRRFKEHESPARIRAALIDGGYPEHEVDEALKEQTNRRLDGLDSRDRRNSRLFAAREFIDRFGYGAAAPQFINILFSFTGASLFLIGLFNGLRTVVSMLITSVLQEYARVHRVSKGLISAAGVLFGFSFFLMAFSVLAGNPWLFAAAMLTGAVGVVAYGDLYNKFVLETLRREKMGGVLRRMGQYGILVTMAATLLSGWLIDRFPIGGPEMSLLGFSFTPIGYVLSFEITAFAFIISSYLFSFVREEREERKHPLWAFVKSHCGALRRHVKGLMKDRYVALLVIATAVTGLLEVLGQSYYGIFIYQEFRHQFLGGFLNVAAILAIAILASFIGPWFTRKLQRAIGLTPMLVFGSLLIAILPFTLVFNPNLAAVAVAFACSVIGGAIVGYAQGLLARKLMGEETRKQYFMSLGILLAPSYLILMPLGAWFAHAVGMEQLFFAVALGLVVVVMPLYFLLVAMANKERL